MTVTTGPKNAARSYATTYAGSRFRSRLEAKWAAFFDLVGWRWTYEPFDTTGYIPDFLIHGRASFIVEVGPCEFLSEFSEKIAKPLAAFDRERPVVVFGVDPLILDEYSESLPRAGYRLRPCGHHDGDNHLRAVPATQLRTLWAEAGSKTQWRSR